MNLCELRLLQSAPSTVQERVDIREVAMDMSLGESERAFQFLSQMKNPYAFRCGNVAVNAIFTSNENSLSSSITAYLSAQKRNNECLNSD